MWSSSAHCLGLIQLLFALMLSLFEDNQAQHGWTNLASMTPCRAHQPGSWQIHTFFPTLFKVDKCRPPVSPFLCKIQWSCGANPLFTALYFCAIVSCFLWPFGWSHFLLLEFIFKCNTFYRHGSCVKYQWWLHWVINLMTTTSLRPSNRGALVICMPYVLHICVHIWMDVIHIFVHV